MNLYLKYIKCLKKSKNDKTLVEITSTNNILVFFFDSQIYCSYGILMLFVESVISLSSSSAIYAILKRIVLKPHFNF